MAILIASGVFTLVFVIILIGLTSRGTEVDQKQNLIRRMARPEGDEVDVDIRKSRRRDEGVFLQLIYKLNLLRKLEESMWQAGVYMRVSEMCLIILLMFASGLSFGQVLWHDLEFASVLGIALGSVPILYIRFRRQRRLKAFVAQLPFALDLIKSSLEAGHSLNRGLQVVVQEFADPLGSEFRTVIEQTRIGLPLPRALEDLLKRVPEDDLRLLVVAVKVQTEVGSSLALIVGRLAEIVRTRQRLRLQIRALTAQSRMGGMIVGFLPIVVLGAFSLAQSGYASNLINDPTGFMILKIAAGLDICAFITIRWMLQLKY